MTKPRRWPIQPLLEAMGLSGLDALADCLGVYHRSVVEWSAAGGFTDLWADRAAVRCGMHPALVWPDWYDVVDISGLLAEERRAVPPAERTRQRNRTYYQKNRDRILAQQRERHQEAR